MKALDLLKNIDRKCCTDRVNGLLDLAIKELEELENRSCDNCKHSLALHNNRNIINSELVCKIDSRYNNKDFCCNKWENKAQITNILI